MAGRRADIYSEGATFDSRPARRHEFSGPLRNAFAHIVIPSISINETKGLFGLGGGFTREFTILDDAQHFVQTVNAEAPTRDALESLEPDIVELVHLKQGRNTSWQDVRQHVDDDELVPHLFLLGSRQESLEDKLDGLKKRHVKIKGL